MNRILSGFVLSRTALRLTCIAVLCLLARGVPAQALPVQKAAEATELPVGSWGPFAPKHLAPSFMSNRKLGQLFTFPIVVGQQRDEILPLGSKTPEGKRRLRPERVTLTRQVLKLGPGMATVDRVRHTPIVRVSDANGDNTFWKLNTAFDAIAPSKEILTRKDGNGLLIPPAPWGAGGAVVEYFPAYADSEVEGLVIRVELFNRSEFPQTYYADLMAGIDQDILSAGGRRGRTTDFSLADLQWTADRDVRVVSMQHRQSSHSFALAAAPGNNFPSRFIVSGACFDLSMAECRKQNDGALYPIGLPAEALREDVAKQADDKFQWSVLRISGVEISPGQTRVLTFCVGTGKDRDSARNSAQTLLSLADDRRTNKALPDRITQPGLYTLAVKSHEAAKYHAAEHGLEKLMAQSLANTPSIDFRRVGVPSRQVERPQYRVGSGGWMALGWTFCRPDWAAAQLNAFFLSNAPVPTDIKHPAAIAPVDLFALWELVQQTHNREILDRFYPYAVSKYQELLAAGRANQTDWLFAWPGASLEDSDAVLGSSASSAQEQPEYSPTYSAFVIRSAQILRDCAKILNRPQIEVLGYSQTINSAAAELDTKLWNETRGVFNDLPVGGTINAQNSAKELRTDHITALLPLITGPDALKPAQSASLLKTLTDKSLFWSDAGIRSVSHASAQYNPASGNQGGIRFGAQWLIWKALLQYGETEKAALLADNLLSAYDRASEKSLGCPEWLNGDTGDAVGRSDYTGDSCALFALYNAYHTPGAISPCWGVYLLDAHYDTAADALKLVFRNMELTPRGVILCEMGFPGGKYACTGGITGKFTADKHGVIALPLPADQTTQQVEIVRDVTAK